MLKLTKILSEILNTFTIECEILTDSLGGVSAMIAKIGNTQRTGYTASKIFHMYRNEKSYYENTDSFLLVHNFINWYFK